MANQYKSKYTIQDMRILAESRGGKCNSLEYTHSHLKLEWECYQGHIWNAAPRSILSGSWCPSCSSGISERICRVIFEQVFGMRFNKCRPKWLRSDKTSRCLELDGYCEELGIAFEFNGTQHYRDVSIYYRSTHDDLKMDLCQKYGVKLFIIPQPDNDYVPDFSYVKSQIKLQAHIFNIILPDAINNNIDIRKIYNISRDMEELEKIKNKAISMGGKCLSNVYLGCHAPLIFQCGDCNYIWEAEPRNINAGSWCLRCVGQAYTINDLIELANLKNGRCLSTQFEKTTKKILWKCEFGHTWEAPFCQVKRGTWCPLCFRKPKNKEMK
jgi:hypothetical protein